MLETVIQGFQALTDPESFIRKELGKADVQVFNEFGPEGVVDPEYHIRPQDVVVTHEDFFKRIVYEGVFQLKGVSLPLGEAYMEGWWHTRDLREFFRHVMGAKLENNTLDPGKVWREFRAKHQNDEQRISKAAKVARVHYDAGTRILDDMLTDEFRQYTCADFRGVPEIDSLSRLDLAQKDKLEGLARKLDLKPGMTLVDIGCGEAFLGAYITRTRPEIKYVGITNSEEHARKSKEAHKDNPNIEIVVSDFRDYEGKADRVIVVGSSEHFGPKGYPEFLKKANDILKNDGDILLIHGIASNEEEWVGDPFLEKYIFPESVLLSQERIARQAPKAGFVIEDMENIGPQYAETLFAWYQNNHNNEFFNSLPLSVQRMWDFYLLSCSVGFENRKLQLHQYVLTKNGREGGYSRPVLRYQEA